MQQTRYDRVMALVHSCSDMGVGERERFLSQECAGDHKLRAEVQALLDEGGASTSFQRLPERFEKDLPDHYRLIRQLGSGGMAEVFLAEDTRLGRQVAIKFLNEAYRKDADLMRRFDLEARAASALNHPNIITVYDIGVADGVQYIVSEYIDGGTLGSRLVRGRLSPGECVDIAIQAASALSAAHKAGIVHRDLKPDNIMLRSDGSVKVVDFGLAKATGNTISAGHNGKQLNAITTMPGLVLGTPAYMSPEQARGIPLDGRSDIFSFGIILFQMLTGHLPFSGSSSIDTIAAIVGKEPRRIDRYIDDPPEKLVRVIDCSLEKDRAKRYQSMQALLFDLEDLKDELGSSSIRRAENNDLHSTRIQVETAHLANRRLTFHTVTAIAVAALLVAGGWWLWAGSRRGILSPDSLRTVQIESWNTVSAENMNSATFSPNAQMVAYASKQTGASEIWAKPVGPGGRSPVTKNGFYNDYPVWSPDGKQIAYYSKRSGSSGIWRVTLAGGTEQPIVDGISAGAMPVRWCSDNDAIYIQNDGELLSVNTMSGERKPVTHFASMGLRPRRINVSQDCTEIAILIEQDDSWIIRTGKIGADALTEIVRSKVPIDDGFVFAKGSVFYSAPVDGSVQIFAASPGHTPEQLSRTGSDAYTRDVSYDGTKILYTSVNESSDLWTVNAADGKQAVVADDVAEEYWPALSPDGRSVAYQVVAQPDKPTSGSIFVRPVAGGSAVRVSADGSCPVWSHDGQWLAFLRRTANKITLWKVRSTGGEPTELSDNATGPGYVSTPYLKLEPHTLAWAPDDSQVAYAARTDGYYNIWSAAANGSKNQPLSLNKDAKEIYCCAVWSDEREQLVFSTFAAAGSSKGERIWIKASEGGTPQMVFESKQNFRFLGLAAGSKEAVVVRKTDETLASSVVSTDIILVSLENGQERKVGTVSDAYFDNFHLTGDGRTIAFVTRTNGTTDLWTLPITGGAQKRILSDNEPKDMISSLALSRDGTTIVFGKQTRTNLISMLAN